MNYSDNSLFKNCYETNSCDAQHSAFQAFTLVTPDGDSIIANGSGIIYDHNMQKCTTWNKNCPIQMITKAKISGNNLSIQYQVNVHETISFIKSTKGETSFSIPYIKASENFILYCEDGYDLTGINNDGTPICILRPTQTVTETINEKRVNFTYR